MMIEFGKIELEYLKLKERARETHRRLKKQKYGGSILYKEKSFEAPEKDTFESEEIWI